MYSVYRIEFQISKFFVFLFYFSINNVFNITLKESEYIENDKFTESLEQLFSSLDIIDDYEFKSFEFHNNLEENFLDEDESDNDLYDSEEESQTEGQEMKKILILK